MRNSDFLKEEVHKNKITINVSKKGIYIYTLLSQIFLLPSFNLMYKDFKKC